MELSRLKMLHKLKEGKKTMTNKHSPSSLYFVLEIPLDAEVLNVE